MKIHRHGLVSVILWTIALPAVVASSASHLRYALFVGHRVNWELTLQAVERTLELGANQIRLIDTSAALTTEQLQQVPEGVTVLDTVIPLSFSQMQEFIRKTAIKEDLEVYFWIHSDVLLSKGTAVKAVEAVESIMVQDPQWGIVFFSYDLFCAFHVDAVRELPWDLAIPHYKGDYDYYQSMHRSGRVLYGNAPHPIRTHGVPAHLPWPHRSAIQHVSHGSVLVRAIQDNANSNNHATLEMTQEELWGYWLTDYVGRYLYFLLKWGYTWPQFDEHEDHFASAHDLWAWTRILLRLPSPGMNNTLWNIGKVYVVVSLVTLPILGVLAVCFCGCKMRQNQRRAWQKRAEHKTV